MAVRRIQHSRGTSYEMTGVVDGRVVRRRYPTRKQALDGYARLRQQAADGTFIPADRARTTFATWAAEWLAGLQVRPSTRAQYSANLRHHLLPTFGPVRLDRIERRDVVAFVAALADGPLAPATVRGVVNLLRTILRAAVDDGRLARTPCVRITLPEVPPRRLAVFNDDQVAALVAAVRPEHRALLLLALGTGLRQGELLGVTADVLDLDAGTLAVDQQLAGPAGPGRPQLTRLLKTRASRRVLPLPRFALDALRAHLATYGTGEQGLLFCAPSGAGWRRGSFNAAVWKPLLARAGLPVGYGMHALRHTYASTLIAQGQHVKVIQERLGHASISETMDTYGHLFPQAHAETAAALDARYGPLSQPRLRAV